LVGLGGHVAGRIGEQIKAICSRGEVLASCPQPSVGRQLGGCPELDVDVTDARPEQSLARYEGRKPSAISPTIQG